MSQQHDATPVIETRSGPVRGFLNAGSGQHCFFGIPYAEPPLGALRFRAPKPVAPWREMRDCRHFGAAGTQIFDPTEGAYEEFTDAPAGTGPAPWVGSEDCLTLNIWRRSKGGDKRPVLVWIHGGANWLESSRLAIYHGDNFVARQDVVFISLNYRLGVFGWLDLSGIGGPEYRGSHSNGLRDQILALTWIRDNIAAFGGDPANITVMGESAGSIDISWHLAAGRLQEVARRVVMMSGIANLPGLTAALPHEWSEAHAVDQANIFLAKLGVTSMAQFEAMSTAEIMEGIVRVAAASDTLFDMDSLFWPRVSDTYAATHPFAAARNGAARGMDILIGCTDYEMGLWLNWDDNLDRHPALWMAEKLPLLSPQQRREVAALYENWFRNEPQGSAGMHLLGDILFRLPTIWFADAAAEAGGRVWAYLFDWSVDDRRRALHAADQSFLFKKWETAAGRQLVGSDFTPEDARLRDRTATAMMDSVLAFAMSGDPARYGDSSLPHWAAYDTASRSVMRFGRDIVLDHDPALARRTWWTEAMHKQLGQ